MSNSPKVLWVGPLWDMTGYAHATNASLLALEAAGIDVIARAVHLTNQKGPPPIKVQELEKKSGKPDVIIQHMLPPLMSHIGNVPNIGYFHWETSNFRKSGWQYPLNLMNQLWVSCRQNENACVNSSIQPPVKTVKIPLDLESYKLDGPVLLNGLKDKYVFYCIGDWSTRKDMEAVIRAYYYAFTSTDHVILILKTYIDNTSPQQSEQRITAAINEIKAQMRLHHNPKRYPPVVIITKYLPEESIHALHRQGNCYVTAERGAAWNIPAAEAIAFGNAVITGDFGGPSEYMRNDPNTGLHICESVPRQCYGMNHSYRGVYTANESWGIVDDVELGVVMKYRFDSSKNAAKFERTGVRAEILEELAPARCGETMKQHIMEVLNAN
jgi:glycosyltransferase involved in cell wall biosynthesis